MYRQYKNQFAFEIAAKLAAGRPALCFNTECDNELHVLPTVMMFIRTTDDPHVPAIVMGACESCAKQNDDDLRDMMRKGIGHHHGLSGPPEETARVEMDVPGCVFSIEGVQIAVVQEADKPICTAAVRFANLLEYHLLPRFLSFRHGFGNCHSIVDQLYLDLEKIGLDHLFAFKRGSSKALKTTTDQKGLHSWIETDGWVIDASNGATSRPVLVVPAGDYYANLQLTNIHDIPRPEGVVLMGQVKRKMSAQHHTALNDLCDRIDAVPAKDSLSFVKAIVAETLKFPGTTEETRLAILTEMENGGYEALLHMLQTTKIPEGFDPNDRPWNRS